MAIHDSTSPPVSVAERTARDLSLIARVMERAAGFPAVSPGGWIAMGLIGAGLGPLANRLDRPESWLAGWLSIAALAVAVGLGATLRTARAQGFQVWSRPGGFWFQLATPLAVGLVLTLLWSVRGRWELLPGTWLVFYGLGLAAGGSWCRRSVRGAGLAFLALGLCAFGWPAAGPALLVLGFGAVHLVTGWTMRRP